MEVIKVTYMTCNWSSSSVNLFNTAFITAVITHPPIFTPEFTATSGGRAVPGIAGELTMITQTCSWFLGVGPPRKEKEGKERNKWK